VRRAAARKAMRDHDISQRRACRLVGVDPKTVRRDHPPDNPDVREEMKAIACKRRRFGYPLADRRWVHRREAPDRRPVGTQGNDHEPQETISPLHRRKTWRETPKGPQTRAWITKTNASRSTARRTLVTGFCVRYIWCVSQVPHVGCER